jgi:outer membrane receptor protein involved in Fe transport
MGVRDTTKRYQPSPGYYTDEAPFGYWGNSVSGIDGMSMGGWMNLGRDQSVNSTTSFKFDFMSQLNFTNQLKAGFEFIYNDYNINAGTFSPSMSTWTREQAYQLFPYRLSAYFQDKLEFEGFIMNLGLRAEYSDPNTDWFKLSDYDKEYSAGYGNSLENSAQKENIKGQLYLSPRLGVSHPITDNSKLYFNYGHFLSEPASSYRFRLQRESNGLVTFIGNPNLKLERTIAYELGYSQNLFNRFLLNISAYYKDVIDQIGWVYFQNLNSTVQYNKAANNNYADIRGLEITLSKIWGRWIRGFVNYTYDVRTSGYFGLTKYFEDPVEQRDYLKLNPYQSKPNPQPFARINLELLTPSDFGPEISGSHPFADITLNILADWKAGAYTTFNPHNIPGIIDNVQWADWYNIDIRFSKDINLEYFNLRLYVDVNNVLNTKHLSQAGFSDVYDYNDYLESLNFSWEEGDNKGNDKIGDYRPDNVAYEPLERNPDNDPAISRRNDERKKNKSYIDMPNIKSMTFLNPRKITFGIKLDF